MCVLSSSYFPTCVFCPRLLSDVTVDSTLTTALTSLARGEGGCGCSPPGGGLPEPCHSPHQKETILVKVPYILGVIVLQQQVMRASASRCGTRGILWCFGAESGCAWGSGLHWVACGSSSSHSCQFRSQHSPRLRDGGFVKRGTH